MTIRVNFVGRLGFDPDPKYTSDGTMVVDLRIATKSIKGDTAWADVTTWGRLAENCNEYLQKGDLIMVVGRLEFDPETGGPVIFDRKDGSIGSSFEVTATDIEFISTGGKHGGGR